MENFVQKIAFFSNRIEELNKLKDNLFIHFKSGDLTFDQYEDRIRAVNAEIERNAFELDRYTQLQELINEQS